MNRERVILSAAVANAHQKVAWILHRKENQEVTEREVEIYQYDEHYIDCYCRLRGAVRSFRIENLLDILVEEESFERRPEIVQEVKARGHAIPWGELWDWMERMVARHERALKEESLALMLGVVDSVAVGMSVPCGPRGI
jgi:predicted DNA-binding transcriptional regulator YafY